MTLFSRLHALANLRENKVLANIKCFTVYRLPFPTDDTNTDDVVDSTHVFHVTQLEVLPVTAEKVYQRTARDPILPRAYDATMRGWCDNKNRDLQPYYRRRTELTDHQGCLLWGIRVFIAEILSKDVLNVIHHGH